MIYDFFRSRLPRIGDINRKDILPDELCIFHKAGQHEAMRCNPDPTDSFFEHVSG